MNDIVISTIRTTVPAFVGPFVLLLTAHGIAIDDIQAAGLTSFVIAFATGAYYLAVRVIAKKYPWVEALLGVSKKPAYTASEK